MSNNIIKCDDVKIDKVNYTKPEKNGQSYFSSISYGDTLNPLYIQTPKLLCRTNISEMKNKKVPYLDVEVPTGKMNIYDFLLSLDDNNIKTNRPVQTHFKPKNIGFHKIFNIRAGINSFKDLVLFFKYEEVINKEKVIAIVVQASPNIKPGGVHGA